MDIALIERIFPFIVQAGWVTVELTVVSLLIGLVVASLLVIAKFSRYAAIRWIATAYISVMRGTPLLVQLFLVFFGGPQFGFEFTPFVAGVITMGFNIGAYMSEGMRGAILAVDKGQNEAARSLGLNASQSMRHVILPQAFKRVLPPLAGQFISLVKDTSLVSVIAITELTKSGREAITTSFSTFEIWFCVAGLYLLINLPLSHIASRLERRLAQSD